MSARTSRLPWVILGLTLALLGGTLTLSALNHALTSDAYFIAIAILMMLGYVTVGAFVASRLPGNPLGWLLMTTGFAFLLAAGAEEYAPRAAECGASAYIPKAVFGPDRLESAWAAANEPAA